ncbi:MAG: hypothetical protein GX125_06575 [Bacteroidales bacterium]|jgi:hypothetical protein|nr:hypothetical protein [Bacteroidota bacterium]NLN99909.1 hypothetical protein [Bacteroidales bacterium]
MSRLPEFVLANAPGLPVTVVIQTVPPYLIRYPYGILKKDADRVEEGFDKERAERLGSIYRERRLRARRAREKPEDE